ncbi:MAG: HepT-like ribonuclease domain-containing protein [Hormoscilla sp.]
MPWPQIISMRNSLIHADLEIDLDAVWDRVTEEIPMLIIELEQIITESE